MLFLPKDFYHFGLKNMQNENPEFWMKLQHALSEDLIKKVKPSAKKESQINK